MHTPESAPNHEYTPEQLSAFVSLIMLKPENMPKEAIFPAILKNYGFAAEAHTVVLTKDVLLNMYPDLPQWEELIQQATYDHLLDKTVTVFLLSPDTSARTHDNVVQEVLTLRGTKTSPQSNKPHTLRAVYHGEKRIYGQDDTITYWENGIHCPRNPAELVQNLEALNLLERATVLATEAESITRQD